MPVHRPPHPLRVSFLVAALAMLAPFTLDTYLPSFPAIAADLGAGPADMQRTLSDYLWAFGAMMLVYGPLSDALGRRRVVLVALLLHPRFAWLRAGRGHRHPGADARGAGDGGRCRASCRWARTA